MPRASRACRSGENLRLGGEEGTMNFTPVLDELLICQIASTHHENTEFDHRFSPVAMGDCLIDLIWPGGGLFARTLIPRIWLCAAARPRRRATVRDSTCSRLSLNLCLMKRAPRAPRSA